MIVYRVCHIDELDNLIKGRFEELGKEYNREIMKDTNTHMYHDGVKYLHFFERIESIMYLRLNLFDTILNGESIKKKRRITKKKKERVNSPTIK